MDDSRPPQHLPALRGEERANDADPARPPGDEPPRTPRGPSEFATKLWKRLTRTARGAAGVAVLAAALLLWPFSDWAVIPWLAGIATLVLLALLRVDRLLRGWVWHVGGLVVVGGLMWSTSPWAWFLAASIGVLIAGVVRLPAWRLAAVGAVLCLVSGTAFGIANFRTTQQLAAEQAQAQVEARGRQGAPTPTGVLPIVLNRIAQNSPGAVCDNLMVGPAADAFVASVGAPDCPAAVAAVAAEITDRNDYAEADAPSTELADGLRVDACELSWGTDPAAGPQFGVLTIGRTETGASFVVTAFEPCSTAG